MKILKNFIGLAAIALCLGFASCSSDDDEHRVYLVLERQ